MLDDEASMLRWRAELERYYAACEEARKKCIVALQTYPVGNEVYRLAFKRAVKVLQQLKF